MSLRDSRKKNPERNHKQQRGGERKKTNCVESCQICVLFVVGLRVDGIATNSPIIYTTNAVNRQFRRANIKCYFKTMN